MACTQDSPQAGGRESSPLDTAYWIDDMKVDLVDGKSDVEAAPGSATRITTAVLGEAVEGDLNGDGRPDAVVILVQNPGGSGTFYYVAAAVNDNGRYEGSPAVFLGDRIEPVGVVVESNTIRVTFRDRRPDEPMSAAPSVEKSIHLAWADGGLSVLPPP